MKKAFLITGILTITIVVFSFGVFSGIYNGQYGFQPKKGINKRRNLWKNNKINNNLKYKNKNFKKISGDSVTINGVPISIWEGKNIDKPKNIANHYLNTWSKKGLVVNQRGNPDSSFTHTIDPKSKMFYGALASSRNNSRSTVIPFSVAMSDSHPKDKWSKDFPLSLRKKKGFHLRSTDGPKEFEKFLYTEKYPVSQAASSVKSALFSTGWKLQTTAKKDTHYGVANIMCFSKNKKQCIVNIAKNPKKIDKGSMVMILLGNI